MTLSKIIYLALSIILLLALPFLTYGLDWSEGYFLPLAVISMAVILGLAALNFKNTFLFIILILPTIYHFNYLKINIFSYLPFFNNFSFFLNPVSVIYLLIILFGLLVIIEKKSELKSLPLKYFLLLTSVLAAASLFWSADFAISLIELIYLLVPFSMYLIAYVYFNDRLSFIKLLLIAIFSSIIPLITALGQLITGSYFYEPDSSLGRLIGTLDHPNTLGLFLVLIIGLLVSFYLAKPDQKIKHNKSIVLYLLALAFFLVLTYSRTSWLCLAILIILLIFIARKIILLLLTSLPIALVLFLAFENIRYRLMEIFDLSIFNSITARLNIWQVAWEKFLEQPIFGYGIGLSERTIELAKDWQGGTSLPHNDFLLFGLELGIVGVIFYLLYTLGAIYQTFKAFKKSPDKIISVNLYGHELHINFKTIAFGLLAILIALLPATFFESLSQKIILQVIIYSILGGLFSINQQSEES
jgi:O-antigen ligase